MKIKVFNNEEDACDDNFLQKNTFTEVTHMAQLLFDHEYLEKLYSYRERRLAKVPLDQLLIKPIREPTSSATVEGDSKENSKIDSGVESQDKSTRESQQSSLNGKIRSMESVKDTTKSTQKIVEETSASKQAEILTTSAQPIKAMVIDLEEK